MLKLQIASRQCLTKTRMDQKCKYLLRHQLKLLNIFKIKQTTVCEPNS